MTLYIYLIIACIVAAIYIGLCCYATFMFKTVDVDDTSIVIAYGILAGVMWPAGILVGILFLIGWLVLYIEEKIQSFRNKRK